MGHSSLRLATQQVPTSQPVAKEARHRTRFPSNGGTPGSWFHLGQQSLPEPIPGCPKGVAQFQKSIFLGKSDSNLVGTISGTKVARTIRRNITPYQAECLLQVKGVPWNFSQEALGVKLKYRKPMPAMGNVPFVDEEAEAVKKAALEHESSSEEEPDEALLKLLENQPPEQVPKTPSIIRLHRPRSPEVQLRAPTVETKGTKRPMEVEGCQAAGRNRTTEPGGVRYEH